jgi:hypothetical protein
MYFPVCMENGDWTTITSSVDNIDIFRHFVQVGEQRDSWDRMRDKLAAGLYSETEVDNIRQCLLGIEPQRLELCRQYFGDLIQVAVGERAGVRKKPAPDTVLEALHTLDVPADTAVYIGDSDVDIQTALAAGMPCISVAWGLRDEDFLRQSGATRLVHTAEELLACLFSDEG